MDLVHDIKRALNKHGVDTGTNTPDFVLAEMVVGQLDYLREAIQRRDGMKMPGPVVADMMDYDLVPETDPEESFIEWSRRQHMKAGEGIAELVSRVIGLERRLGAVDGG